MGQINDLVNEIHNIAKDKGWYNPAKTSLEVHMLIVSEIAEATEHCRNSNQPFFIDKNGKPDGEAVELVDAVIRIMDYFGYKEWNLEQTIEAKMEYNKTRSYRHGNKKY